jgi:PhnB protein
VQLVPYLNFNGQCEAAFKFYEQCLDGKIVAMIPFGETPAAEHVSARLRNQIIHARLVVGNAVLMGSDCPTEDFKVPEGFNVALQIDDPAAAERIFRALAEGGEVRMPFEKTFWADRFGMVVDRFGTPWMINCEKAA